MKITVLNLNQPNKNGRIYTTETVAAALTKYAATIDLKQAVGELVLEDTILIGSTVNLSNVSHIVENAEIDGDHLIADIRVLRTTAGEQLAYLLQLDKIAFRPRGLGKIDSNQRVTDYEFISIDAVLIDRAA